MTRSILCGLLALISVGAMGAVPIACQSGGVGDPCTPEDEYNTQFPGFKVAEENIESRSFQCATRICLVNHFQGRVSCPYGQPPPVACGGPTDTSCANGAKCVESQTLTPECSCKQGDTAGCAAACGNTNGLVCDPKLGICGCTSSQTVGDVDYFCGLLDPNCKGNTCTRVLKSYVCHNATNCQNGDPDDTKNANKDCCVPGTDKPISVPVCGQCDNESHRNAEDAVYCSCRCCPKCCGPDVPAGEPCEKDKSLCGEACDPNFNYCDCPQGFSCTEIRKNVGLGDAQLTGAYCIRDNTEYLNAASCGKVKGYTAPGTGECIGQ